MVEFQLVKLLDHPTPPAPVLTLRSQQETSWQAQDGISNENPNEQKLSSPTPPVLTIIEQPAQHYRFRYKSEVGGNRLGGLLSGRSSDDTNKSFLKVQISGIDPTMHSQLHLTACTVNSDKAPHPYYLHGDSCHDGYFEINKSIDEKSRSVWDVKFEKLAVICVQKKSKSDIQNSLQARAEKVPHLHDMKDVSACSGNALFSSIRLAFSLTFTDKLGASWILPTVYSDEVMDLKEKKKTELSIECLNPDEVPMGVASEIAIYTKTPTNGLQKNEVKVQFTVKSKESTDESAETTVELDVIDMKKHLLIVKTPVLRSVENERIKCEVTVRYNQFVTKEKLNILFMTQQSGIYKVPGIAMKRAASD